ncbi:MAG: DEAD/DEAH box helicase family protein [Flavobacterium sp.]|uniref:Hint domain-containing protein n=1 Tax=Flavobacterium sp. TaxID=239 RepID=UPI00262D1A7D|nr:DEAD/DEAH box helicase family protein [Flavobacterium sp.]MDD5151792.1 DEAD/DEAH box helicase family protein [Flavobacterium sp.]
MISEEITLEELELLVANGYIPQIDTITGKENITHTYRKNSEGKLIIFDDNSAIKAANNHLILVDGIWKSIDSLDIGTVIHNKIIQTIIDIDRQDWVDFTVDSYHNTYIHNDIIHHNSGKSHIIFLVCMFLLEYTDTNILIIVPTTSLVSQMIGDFESYNKTELDIRANCHPITGGLDKNSKKRITIGTWQSIYTQNEEYFKRYGAVFVDECIHPDTIIKTKNTDKKIKDIKIGDEVLTFNESTQINEYKPVIDIHKNLSHIEKKYKIKLVNGSEIIITGNHKVLTDSGWKRADILTIKDKIKQ